MNAVGNDHPVVAQTLTSYGSFIMRMAEYDRALKMFMEALKISEVCLSRKSLWKHATIRAPIGIYM